MTKETLILPWLNDIRFVHLRFIYRSISSGQIIGFLGPELRGSIGHQLKQFMGCYEDRNEDCQICSKREQAECIYAHYFYNDKKPHLIKGFILKTDPLSRGLKRDFHRGDTFRFDLILFGENGNDASHFLTALTPNPLLLGEQGLIFRCEVAGSVDTKGHFLSLHKIKEIPWRAFQLFERPKRGRSSNNQLLELRFLTPVEITITHKKFARDTTELSFKVLILRLLERTRNIAKQYCNADRITDVEYKAFIGPYLDLAERIVLLESESRARWLKVKLRNRSDRLTGGLVGTVVFRGKITPFEDLLNAAALLGIGRGTTHGFGQISWRLVQNRG